MARQTTNSLFNSLRGRIWISTSVLAFFICTFGLISYLVVTLLINDVFYGIFIPFLFLAFTVVVFGWWLSNEIVRPIEKVSLLAKSLERTHSSSVPKTSGSVETDELLQTIFRNSQQVQTMLALMEKVASGKTDISLSKLEGSDKLLSTFQDLLAKVAESVTAKEDLDELAAALERLKRETAPIRSGNFSITLAPADKETKEVVVAVNTLLEALRAVVSSARDNSFAAQEAAEYIGKHLEVVIEQDETRVEEMTQASIVLKQVPGLVQKISNDLNSSTATARKSIEKVQKGARLGSRNSEAVGKLRRQLREAVAKVQGLNERSQDIAKLAATVEDLANRTSMVALNASIQATELGEKGQGFALVAEEVERLAERAHGTNQQIANLNKSITAEIKKVENVLEVASGDASEFSRFSIESANVLAELERLVGQVLNLQENLLGVTGDRSEETDRAFMTFLNSIADIEATVDELKHSSAEILTLGDTMKNLGQVAGAYRTEGTSRKAEEEAVDRIAAEDEAEETSGEIPAFHFTGLETPEAPQEPAPPTKPSFADPGKEPMEDASILEVPLDLSTPAQFATEEPELEIAATIAEPIDGEYVPQEAEGIEIAQYYASPQPLTESSGDTEKSTRKQ